MGAFERAEAVGLKVLGVSHGPEFGGVRIDAATFDRAVETLEAADELADAVVHRPVDGELMAAALRRYAKVRGLEKEELDDRA